ncbi:unnamed protein product [Acanthosepion pharaonis]|uniref:Uncharacterized protein n=1 Tax=Acanthosepion pharaonis TaxID=158019 RepID=A0A812ARX2_ACAPH|nr:unnamed protein product [Sepia pharaonis]
MFKVTTFTERTLVTSLFFLPPFFYSSSLFIFFSLLLFFVIIFSSVSFVFHSNISHSFRSFNQCFSLIIISIFLLSVLAFEPLSLFINFLPTSSYSFTPTPPNFPPLIISSFEPLSLQDSSTAPPLPTLTSLNFLFFLPHILFLFSLFFKMPSPSPAFLPPLLSLLLYLFFLLSLMFFFKDASSFLLLFLFIYPSYFPYLLPLIILTISLCILFLLLSSLSYFYAFPPLIIISF